MMPRRPTPGTIWDAISALPGYRFRYGHRLFESPAVFLSSRFTVILASGTGKSSNVTLSVILRNQRETIGREPSDGAEQTKEVIHSPP